MPGRARRCSICRRTGHDRRNCNQLQVQQQQYVEIHCVLCESRHHDLFDCPIIMEYDVILPRTPPSTQRTVSLSSPQSSHRIHWDTCGKCALPNNGGICSCGEKQVAPVPPNEDGIYECTICYADLKELNKVTTKCGHHYCVDCLLHHFTSSNPSSKSCPMCRADLLEKKMPTPMQQPVPIIQGQFRIISDDGDLYAHLYGN